VSTVAGVVLTHNEERHIAECLASLAWCDERVVVDSFSADRTVELARAAPASSQGAGVRVVRHPFANYSQQRNAALEMTTADWVLFVDADERVRPALAAEVRAVTADPTRPEAGWWIPRDNLIFGRLTRGAGWSPDYQLRLLRRGRARYDPARAVHEVAELDGPDGRLTERLLHYNYDTLPEFLEKQERYTAYDAQILFGQGVRARPQNYVLQPLRHFWWRFVTLRGYVDGWHGLVLSALMAYYQWRLYVQLGRMGAAR
jgi:(heptosyl)LPS beta-1,4-glucosyltransferase